MLHKVKLARRLRKQMTDAEQKLMYELRRRQIEGFRFRKQVPLGIYVVDFVCFEARLIIELDGGQHNEYKQINYDNQRTAWLQTQGYQVQRFWNDEVLQEIDAVKRRHFKYFNPPFLAFPRKG